MVPCREWKSPAWELANLEKSTTKSDWGGREGGCHRQDRLSRKRRLRERADISALETCGQAQFTGFKVLSVAALSVAAAAAPGTGRKSGMDHENVPSNACWLISCTITCRRLCIHWQNPWPVERSILGILIPGMVPHAEIPCMGSETRREVLANMIGGLEYFCNHPFPEQLPPLFPPCLLVLPHCCCCDSWHRTSGPLSRSKRHTPGNFCVFNLDRSACLAPAASVAAVPVRAHSVASTEKHLSKISLNWYVDLICHIDHSSF